MINYSDLLKLGTDGNPLNFTTAPFSVPVNPLTQAYTLKYTFLTPATISTVSADTSTDTLTNYYTAPDLGSFVAHQDGAVPSAALLAIRTIMKDSLNSDPYSVYFGDVAHVNFSIDTSTNPTADIAIGMMDDESGSPAFEGLSQSIAPSATYNNLGHGDGVYGDIWLNAGPAGNPTTYWNSASPGSTQFVELLHEVALSLGLHEPAPNIYTSQQTIMNTVEQPATGMSNPDGTPLFASGLQVADILAIQSIYGANYTERATDTIYGMGHGFGSTPITQFVYTIWDGGGTNIIDASSYNGPGTINLNEGAFSSIGYADSGFAQNNVAIAYGTIIQNAIGTQGADTLVGNLWDNVLAGTGGRNTLYSDQTVFNGTAGIDWSHNDNPGTVGSQWTVPAGQYIPLPTLKDDVLIGDGSNNTFVVGKANDVIDGGYDPSDINNAAESLVAGWGTPGSANYWDSAHQFTPDANNVTHNVSGAALATVDSSTVTSNTADYSKLSMEDQSIHAGSTGITVQPSGDYDSNLDPIYLATKGNAGVDGTDALINVTNFVGTQGNDSFTVDPFEIRATTFFGSTGNDTYVGGASNTSIVDYSKLSMFDSSLTTTSTGIIVNTASDGSYTIQKGASGLDGTDTAQNFVFGEIDGSAGQDTFNISANPTAFFLVVNGGAGSDTFNVSGGQNVDINGDSGSTGEEYSNMLNLTALGGGVLIGNNSFHNATFTTYGSYLNVDNIRLAGNGNTYSEFAPFPSPHSNVLIDMGGINNTVEFANAVRVLGDGTLLTGQGAEIKNAQIIEDPGLVTIERLGDTYNTIANATVDYSRNILSLQIVNAGSSMTVSDGFNTDTFSNMVGNDWIVGSNNGDTYTWTSFGTPGMAYWLGTGDNTITGIAESAETFVYTGGNSSFNNLYNFGSSSQFSNYDTIILGPGITSDEVSVSATNGSSGEVDLVLTVAGHGTVTLNGVSGAIANDGSLQLSVMPRIEFWNSNYQGGTSAFQAQYIQHFHTGGLLAADLGTTSQGLPAGPLPGTETLTASAANNYDVVAASGDKVIQGSASHSDTLVGGTGNDTITGGGVSDSIDAQFGNDKIIAGTGVDQIHLGWGNCDVTLGSGTATVYTEGGDQVIHCGTGLAEILGGTGSNTIYAGAGNAIISGNEAQNAYHLSGNGSTEITDYSSQRDSLTYDGVNVTPEDIAAHRIANNLVLTLLNDPVELDGFFVNNTGQNQTLDIGFASLGSPTSPSATATFTIDSTGNIVSFVVNSGGSNQAPVAENGSFTMNENATLTGNVLANNGHGATTDPDGDTVTAMAGTFVTAHGNTVNIAANGAFTYAPAAEFHGSDSFTFTALDPQGASSTATITIGITPDMPAAKNGSFTLTENNVLTGNVLADNGNGATTDPDGDLVGAQTGTFTTAHGGTVEISGNGAFTYTPAAGFHGSDSFTYTAVDAQGASASATITIGVNPDMPVAENGSFTMAENGTLTGNVLADNGFGPATDPDGDLAGVQAGTITTAQGGTAVIAGNGDFTYNPAHGFFGSDGFGYTLFDQQGESASATINIGVQQGIPVVQNAGFSVAENATLTGNVLADNGHGAAFDPDGDPLTAQAGTYATANGSVTIAANGAFTYTPNAGFFGTDTFNFTALDGFGGAATGTMTVNVAQDLPIAEDGSFTVQNSAVLSGNLLADNGFGAASDPDGDLAGTRAASFTTANGGQVVIHSDGTFTYTPPAGFTGNDFFDYTVLDADGASSNATVQVKVTGSTPVVYNETITVPFGQPVTGNLLANNGSGAAHDPDGDPLHVVGTAAITADGFAVQLSSNGDFTAAIPAWFVGQDSLIYTASDPNGDSATATATLDIAAPANAIVGTSGNDTINDTSNTNHSIFTLQGNDIVHCGGGTDTVYLGPGNDTVYAGTGVDTMIGGGGNDTFNVNSTQDVVIENNQHVADTIISSVSFTLPQNVRDLVLTGTGNLTATCNNQGDTVVTNGGVDTVIGGSGDDTIYVNNSNDVVIEHAGHNSVIASVDYRMPANGVESLTFTGTASLTGQGNNLDNTMFANNGGDVLKDGNGNDTIIGGLGDDVITSGSGTNVIYGGGGNDLVTFGSGSNTIDFKDATAFTGLDTIKGFTTNGAHADVIDIKNVIDTVDPSGNNLHNFLELTHTGNNAFLAVNPDGSAWTNIVKIEHGSGLDLDTMIAHGNLIV